MSSPIERIVDESCEKIDNVERMDDMMNAIIELVNKAIKWKEHGSFEETHALINSIDKVIKLGW